MDEPKEKKKPMTKEDVERIKKSGCKDQEFIERAEAAAEKNKKGK